MASSSSQSLKRKTDETSFNDRSEDRVKKHNFVPQSTSSPDKSNTCPFRSSQSHTIVWIDDTAKVSKVLEEIKDEELLAVDCEGHNLGRSGTLDILTIAKRDRTVYLFDITTMGMSAFDAGLKNFLQSGRSEKLLFDCRSDADVLLHKYQVNIDKVFDLQLLEVVHRREIYPKKALPSRQSKDYWNVICENVDINRGFKKCIDKYLGDKNLAAIKQSGTREIKRDKNKNIWTNRPLSDALKDYCAVDTLTMFLLFDILKEGKDLETVRRASGRYVDYTRSCTSLSNKKYIFHAYLPHNILIDEKPRYGGILCTGCNKIFTKDEFSNIKLRRGNQLCRVCRMVKMKNDERENYEKIIIKQENYENNQYYGDYDD